MTEIQRELRTYASAIAIDGLISQNSLAIIRRALLLITLLAILVFLATIGLISLKTGASAYDIAIGDARMFSGLLLFLLGPLTLVYQVTFFYNTRFFRGMSGINQEDFDDIRGITYEVAKIIAGHEDDLTAGFLASDFGKIVLVRAGITNAETATFLKAPRRYISAETLPLQDGVFLTPQSVGEFLIQQDSSFKEFLFKNGVSEDSFRGALGWIARLHEEAKYKSRWWSKDNLATVPGIGGEFSYGIAYDLKRYMRSLQSTVAFSLISNDSAYANEIIKEIETILTRKRASNVMLIAEPGVGAMDLLVELSKRMRQGKSVSTIMGKQLVAFDADAFGVTHQSKLEFEHSFLKLVEQAEGAGNIIMIIEDFPSFLKNAEGIGVDAGELLGRFLSSSYIQIIATTDSGNWHQFLENRTVLIQKFETIKIEETNLESTVRILEDALWKYERAHKIFFTYASLVRIAESAVRYIVDGVMPDKALNLLAEVAAEAHTNRRTHITPEFVDVCVSARTGIPVGPVREAERERLIHLEDVLHERVIGQQDAIKVIASTMRRSRAGIQDSGRPIGSFLFLGSTGVGKTETAKALAHVFFGSEDNMLRFDMSEFSDGTSLKRLIGDDETPGVLANALRDHPYGVILLDEFEKANEEVHDLFLQILDEGFFTDVTGRRIVARNSIFIATSNAGSDRIWDIVRRGERPGAYKDAIIEAIIKKSIFKPELINRFDSVVIFESLTPVQQKKIAELMLAELRERIQRRGFELVINDALIDVVSRQGSDPEFGARPMRRAIQDIIEEKIAFTIIEKRLEPGSKIELTSKDFAEIS